MRLILFFILITPVVRSQNSLQEIKSIFKNYNSNWSDVELKIQSSYYDSIMGLYHYYLIEELDGLSVYPKVYDLHLNRAYKVVSSNISSPVSLFRKTTYHNHYSDLDLLRKFSQKHQIHIEHVSIGPELNRTRLKKYFILNNDRQAKAYVEPCFLFSKNNIFKCIRLDISIPGIDQSWISYLDVETGNVIEEYENTLHCNLEITSSLSKSRFELERSEFMIMNNSCYRVYPIPIESPNHGARSLVMSPWLKANNASPLGWHNDGQFNYVSSQGNNVDAYEDMDGDNFPTGGDAARAVGGVNKNYDFNYNPDLSPPQNKNSSITNLFYWSNLMHDVLYQYGFTEKAGNFQYNNFNKGGLDLDNVISEGMDNINGARNNASFSCPPDGYPGRMQMYVWQVPTFDTIEIYLPTSKKIIAVSSAISPSLLGPMDGEIVLVNDGTAFPTQGCDRYINANQISGNIALLDRGICGLSTKITNAQLAGAKAMIVCNVDDNPPSVMGGSSSGVGIPIYNISKSDGDYIKSLLNQQVKVIMWPSSAIKFQSLGKSFKIARAAFGSSIPSIFQSDLISVFDDSGDPNDACDNIINNLSGKIALIREGNCEASFKAWNAQLSGASGVIIGRNTPGLPISFSKGSYGNFVTIPVICISESDYNYIINLLPGLGRFTNTLPQLVDADFDGGVIAHEYAHGLSIRLTGGPNNNTCLINAEQAGEGWSDYIGLMMTMKSTDYAYQNRGIATWLSGQNISSVGIRPYPYTVDMSVNPVTYNSIKDLVKISQPHGVGFVWCSMIWDLTWAMCKKYGFEQDIYQFNSTAGNIKSINLIISGLKLQTCNPGFVDARNAILKADTILNGANNSCLIWNVFARRGLGYSANQGSSYLRDDGSESFDIPPGCNYLSEAELFGTGVLGISNILLSVKQLKQNAYLHWKILSNEKLVKFELIRQDERREEKVIHSSNVEFLEFTDKDLNPNQSYKYRVKAIQENNEIILSNWVTFDPLKINQWQLYPNPVDEMAIVYNPSLENEWIQIFLYDLNNRPIDHNQFFYKKSDKIKLSTENLTSGIYYLMIKTEYEESVLRFIKK